MDIIANTIAEKCILFIPNNQRDIKQLCSRICIFPKMLELISVFIAPLHIHFFGTSRLLYMMPIISNRITLTKVTSHDKKALPLLLGWSTHKVLNIIISPSNRAVYTTLLLSSNLSHNEYLKKLCKLTCHYY